MSLNQSHPIKIPSAQGNRAERNIMERINSGLEIVKKETNDALGYEVALTRKTTKSGNIRHAVVITNLRTGVRTRLKSYLGIAPAFRLYKSMMEA